MKSSRGRLHTEFHTGGLPSVGHGRANTGRYEGTSGVDEGIGLSFWGVSKDPRSLRSREIDPRSWELAPDH